MYKEPRGTPSISFKPEFIRSKEELVFDFDELRKLMEKNPPTPGKCYIIDDVGFSKNMTALRDLNKDQAVIIGVDVANMQPNKYGLHELWPYRHFVRPIYELATPHLANILEYFSDDKRYYTNSKGRPRSEDETAQLRERVKVVRMVYDRRIEQEARVAKTRTDNIARRIRDHRIKLQGMRERYNQPFNTPSPYEYHNQLSEIQVLLIDIQQAFNLQ